LQISSETLPKNGELTVSVTVTNKGNYDGYETVQLYLFRYRQTRHSIWNEHSHPPSLRLKDVP